MTHHPALWRIVLGAVVVVFGGLMILRPLSAETSLAVNYVVQSVTVLVAAALIGRRAAQSAGPLRRARALLSASMAVAALGGVATLVVRVSAEGPVPVPSVADLLHFLFLPLCVAGLLSYPVRTDHPGSRGQLVLDGAIATTALWFLTYTLLLAPAYGDAGLSPVAGLTLLGYPAADVFVVAMAVGALHRVAPPLRRELGLCALGVSLIAVSDVVYSAQAAAGRYDPVSWGSAVAELGLVLVVLAVSPTARPASAEHGLDSRLTRVTAVVPAVAVCGTLAVALAAAVTGGSLGGVPLAALVAMVAALALRQRVGVRDRAFALRRLRESKALFRSLVVGSSDLITLHDSSGLLLYASPAVSRLTGLAPDALAAAGVEGVVHPDDLAGVDALVKDLHGRRRSQGAAAGRFGGGAAGGAGDMAGDMEVTGQLLLRLRAADGTWRWCRTTARNLLGDPDIQGVVCNTRDVHEEHLLTQRLQHEAHHDPLTGLGNLAAARRLLASACARVPEPGAVAVLLDLDGFKEVNDTFGHAYGDALLVVVAERLRGCVRPSDTVCRTGGDEFLLMIADGGPEVARRVSSRVLEALSAPVVVRGRSLNVSASIGLATITADALPGDVLRNADLAMYGAKDAGGGSVVAFEPRMHERARRDLEVSSALREALHLGGLELHYQPIVRLSTGEVTSVEALLRWRPGSIEGVTTQELITIAERVGLIREVDAWVLDRACSDLAAGRLGAVTQVAVNVSRRTVTPELPALVEAALLRFDLRGEQLCIEVTETAVASDAAVAGAVLHGLRDLGVMVALDDFGTGQSSLSELTSLPVDIVKIDGSFLTRFGSTGDGGLLSSIIALCTALDLLIVIEGVEDADAVPALAAAGCTFGQGYGLGRPAPVRSAAPVLARRRP